LLALSLVLLISFSGAEEATKTDEKRDVDSEEIPSPSPTPAHATTNKVCGATYGYPGKKRDEEEETTTPVLHMTDGSYWFSMYVDIDSASIHQQVDSTNYWDLYSNSQDCELKILPAVLPGSYVHSPSAEWHVFLDFTETEAGSDTVYVKNVLDSSDLMLYNGARPSGSHWGVYTPIAIGNLTNGFILGFHSDGSGQKPVHAFNFRYKTACGMSWDPLADDFAPVYCTNDEWCHDDWYGNPYCWTDPNLCDSYLCGGGKRSLETAYVCDEIPNCECPNGGTYNTPCSRASGSAVGPPDFQL